MTARAIITRRLVAVAAFWTVAVAALIVGSLAVAS